MPTSHRAAVLVQTLTAADFGNMKRRHDRNTERLHLDFRAFMHIHLGFVDATYHSSSGSNEAERRRLAIETCIDQLIAQEGVDGLVVSMAPSVAELRAHGQACDAAKRKERPWPKCLRRAERNKFHRHIKAMMNGRSLFATKDGWVGIQNATQDIVWD
jgi:hypothetical protein